MHALEEDLDPQPCCESRESHGQPVAADLEPSAAQGPHGLLSRRARMALPIGLGALTLGGCIAVAATNPGDDGVPLCWSRSVFGVDCPFCGGLRATNSLLRADFAAAADHNVVLAVALPVAVLMWIWWTLRAWRGDDMSLPPNSRAPMWISIIAGVLLVAFGVVRNFTGTPWMRWLYSDAFIG